jgi:thymidylate synthase (FAD)
MEVAYLDHMGSDLSVVNAARVSFGKRKEVFDGRDARLIKYLVTHGHVLPFRHPHVSFHFKAPIFVARQLVKHQVGMSWSELSRRYVTTGVEFYWPEEWRAAAPDKKQGSLDGAVDGSDFYLDEAKFYTQQQRILYERLIANGVAPEQARMVLPQNMYTEWHWTGSLLAWAHVWKLRTAPDTQKETRDCVLQIGPTMERLFPVSWKELTDAKDQ